MAEIPMISVLILAKNEERDLPSCLTSVSWSDDIHVFDSFSSDETPAIALGGGAQVHQRAFTNYADQRNAALSGISFKHGWVLLLDADERVPGALAVEMNRFVGEVPATVVAGRIRRRDYLFGTWLKRAQISPYYIRLVRPLQVHYEREINEVLVPHGEVGELREHFDHFPFSKGIAHWIDKHNRYSTMEAARALAEQSQAVPFSLRKACFATDFNVRRYHQKGLFFRLPGRPLIKFIYMMFWRRAILDGRAGVVYACLQCIYEYFIVLKEYEMRFDATLRLPPEPAIRKRGLSGGEVSQ
jgi:glycosyltransferase involved in cell wall biosynthesis